MKAWVRVPGSSGNLGSSFDVAAAALAVYFELEIEVVSEYRGDRFDPGNLVMELSRPILRRAFANKGFKWTMKNGIPMGKGLGSSAAARLGALAAARLLAQSEKPSLATAQEAARLEGHRDNTAASWKGGLTMAWETSRGMEIASWKMPSDLRAVVCIPEISLSTQKARKILPCRVLRQDAVFNLSRQAALTAAITERSYHWLREGMEDRIHQPYRSKLIPGFHRVIKEALSTGAHGACLSGAGPSILAIASVKANLNDIAGSMENTFKRAGVSAASRILNFNNQGLIWEMKR
ncbi:MAG: homoserine kinase [Elusimicrobia bacterium]|nr:homoserine kinase [Elusimicrobiota bacterium]